MNQISMHTKIERRKYLIIILCKWDILLESPELKIKILGKWQLMVIKTYVFYNNNTQLEIYFKIDNNNINYIRINNARDIQNLCWKKNLLNGKSKALVNWYILLSEWKSIASRISLLLLEHGFMQTFWMLVLILKYKVSTTFDPTITLLRICPTDIKKYLWENNFSKYAI